MKDEYKKFLIRKMPAALHLKLKLKAARTGYSMELIVMEAIKKAVEERI